METLIDSFSNHLRKERRLSPHTARAYISDIRAARAFAESSDAPPDNAPLVPEAIIVLRSTDTSEPYIEVQHSARHPGDSGNPYVAKLLDDRVVEVYRW